MFSRFLGRSSRNEGFSGRSAWYTDERSQSFAFFCRAAVDVAKFSTMICWLVVAGHLPASDDEHSAFRIDRGFETVEISIRCNTLRRLELHRVHRCIDAGHVFGSADIRNRILAVGTYRYVVRAVTECAHRSRRCTRCCRYRAVAQKAVGPFSFHWVWRGHTCLPLDMQ